MSDARRDIFLMFTVTRVVSFFLRALPVGGTVIDVVVAAVVPPLPLPLTSANWTPWSVLETILSWYTVR
uniref:Putative secreted protein n=1 Tax=Anopheles darlingi TaxID=43151 RepID=A0A2M4DFA8_ANODA